MVMESEPQLEKLTPEPPTLHTWKRYGNLLAVMALAGGLALAGNYFLDGAHKDRSQSGTAVAQSVSGKGDKVDEKQRLQREVRFMRYTAMLQPVDLNDKNIQSLFAGAPYLTSPMRTQILSEVESGNLQVASIQLWDNFDEDGDVVDIHTGGFTMTVSLTHAPQTILIPYKSGQPLLIVGNHDGGGGITAAISTPSGEAPLPLMSVGQIIEIPLL